jgi:hypothetical protein
MLIARYQLQNVANGEAHCHWRKLVDKGLIAQLPLLIPAPTAHLIVTIVPLQKGAGVAAASGNGDHMIFEATDTFRLLAIFAGAIAQLSQSIAAPTAYAAIRI